jgi:ribosomal protein L11 methyltransferase
VLAIAAVKLGAARVIAVDNDEQALLATRDNAERNGIADKVDLYTPEALPAVPADALVANILAGPLHDLAPLFAQLLNPGAAIALSGILCGQESELLSRYGEWFDQLSADARADWIRIKGRRAGG